MSGKALRVPSWTWRFGCGALASGRYEAAFCDNEIDETVLPSLTPRDAEGAWRQRSSGHRLKAAGCYRCSAYRRGRQATFG